MQNLLSANRHNAKSTQITTGGLETQLIFHDGVELPCFAAFPLVMTDSGKSRLDDYFKPFTALAMRYRARFVFSTPTWRASADWGARLGFTDRDLVDVQRESIELLRSVRAKQLPVGYPSTLTGVLGPRGDGYVLSDRMTVEEAASYHRVQIESLADAGADEVGVFTMTYAEEAAGVAVAAAQVGIPLVVSFTLEVDGRLPSGQSLKEAIEFCDRQSAGYPQYYGVNCAHPDHCAPGFNSPGDWKRRLGGLWANASCKSHAELESSTELDAGNPRELGRQVLRIVDDIPSIQVLGGCCGTDIRHVAAIAQAVLGDVSP